MREYLIGAVNVMARILAGIMILIYAFTLLSILEEGHKPLPFVLQGAPFGTYAHSTQLGILTLCRLGPLFGRGHPLILVGANGGMDPHRCRYCSDFLMGNLGAEPRDAKQFSMGADDYIYSAAFRYCDSTPNQITDSAPDTGVGG